MWRNKTRKKINLKRGIDEKCYSKTSETQKLIHVEWNERKRQCSTLTIFLHKYFWNSPFVKLLLCKHMSVMRMQAKIKNEMENRETQKLRQIWMYEKSCYFHHVEKRRETEFYIGNIKQSNHVRNLKSQNNYKQVNSKNNKSNYNNSNQNNNSNSINKNQDDIFSKYQCQQMRVNVRTRVIEREKIW